MTAKGKSFIRWALIGFLLLACSVGVAYRRTLQGLYVYRFSKWEEDGFKGKPLSQLRQLLDKQNRELILDDGASFYARTGKELDSNQRLMRFEKGEPYPWFPIGTANNVGYVVIQEGSQEDLVVDVVRSRMIDSL